MSKHVPDPRRRRALVAAVSAVAAAPFINVLLSARVRSEDLPHLEMDDPAAQALQYHHDASQAPRVEKPGAPAAEQFCHNCRFIQADSGEWRPCQLFPGKAVNADGWCSAWAEQQ